MKIINPRNKTLHFHSCGKRRSQLNWLARPAQKQGRLGRFELRGDRAAFRRGDQISPVFPTKGSVKSVNHPQLRQSVKARPYSCLPRRSPDRFLLHIRISAAELIMLLLVAITIVCGVAANSGPDKKKTRGRNFTFLIGILLFQVLKRSLKHDLFFFLNYRNLLDIVDERLWLCFSV